MTTETPTLSFDGKIIEVSGELKSLKVTWTLENLLGLMGGPFKIVTKWKGHHVLESSDWHVRREKQNMVASNMIGRALHGKILIVKERVL